ncbi:hypothetical protein BS78_06G087400 [Paspalum vaginatum]|nr:hypothetical protein BS78_06G087400 [Paspalum vaginatum]
MAIHSHLPVSAQSSDNIDGSSSKSSSPSPPSSGELAAGGIPHDSAQRTRRLDPDGDVLPVSDGSVPNSGPQRGHGEDNDEQDDLYLQLRELAASPGYVSLEDVLGTAAFQEGSSRPPEAGISHPLVRTASRLYALNAGPRPQHRRQRSPGPLGTRRGSTMHGVVKKYVQPFLGFLADVFCCALPS